MLSIIFGISIFPSNLIYSNSYTQKLKHQDINPTQIILANTILFIACPRVFLPEYTGNSLSTPLPPFPPPQPSRVIWCKEKIKWKRDSKVIVKQLNMRLELLRQKFYLKCWRVKSFINLRTPLIFSNSF